MAFEIVDGMTGTKHISSDDLAALNTATVGKADCVLEYGNDFALTMASANSATLGTGVGMVGGKRFWNQAPVQLTVESGAQGQKRNDLVVARYSKTTEGIESIEPVVIKGTPTTGTPADPATTANDLKLWRVPLNGITVGTPVKLFSPVTPLATLGDSVSRALAVKRLYDSGGWHIWNMGKLVMVCASGVVIASSGSWDKANCPYTIPDGLRPANDLTTGGASSNGALSTVLTVESDGSVYVNNAGGGSWANENRYASLTYFAG